MSQADFVEHIGEKNLVANVRDALRRAREIDAGSAGMDQEAASDLEHAYFN
jgi:hypothetical protein